MNQKPNYHLIKQCTRWAIVIEDDENQYYPYLDKPNGVMVIRNPKKLIPVIVK